MAVTINGSAGVTTNSGAVYDSLQRGTAVSASGTSVDFTSIPSWVRRITVMYSAVSTNGSSLVQIQIGAGSVTTSGYTWAGNYAGGAGSSATTGFGIDGGASGGAAYIRTGQLVLTLLTSNTWIATNTGTITANLPTTGSGSIALSGTLDRVRITTVNGTDTFDAGTINIIYE